ncbi:calcium-binding protein [Actinoplanes sp. GCM10030250]|uniref:calcium-binding protein n=1 Tax=Actinoplanes sp. GCM10030250 TaxID=3273376 RepID=UPI00360F7664
MSPFLLLSRAGLTLLTGAAVLGASAIPAQAATTGVASVVSGTQIQFRAGSNAVNKVVVTRSGNTVTVDDRVAVKAGKGCKKVKGDKTKVRCKPGKPPTRVRVSLGAKNDSVVNRSGLAMTASGGDGKDSLTGGPRADRLTGGAGADRLYGLGGNDWLEGSYGNDMLSGGDGDDLLSGGENNDREYGGNGRDTFSQGIDLAGAGPDADLLSGGAGDDFADYSGRRYGITADSDGVKGDDGRKGEHDTLTGIDRIWGGTGNDRLYGTAWADDLQGGPGNDTLLGYGGNDQLFDGAGNNRLEGGAGNDRLGGGPGADILLGGSGEDTLSYADRTAAVTVDLDGASRDDGQANERDTVGADVENLIGGNGSDRLTGNAAANKFNGMAGDDIIRGGAGNDGMESWEGRDQLFGEDGDDYLYGGQGDGVDRLDGGGNGSATGDNCVVYNEDAGTDVAVNCEYNTPADRPLLS